MQPLSVIANSLAHLAVINTQATTILIIFLVVLLGLSFAVSGAKVAFFSLTHKDINLLKTKQQHSYKRIIDLLEHPKLLLACLLIANCFANIAIIIVSNILVDNIMQFKAMSPSWLMVFIIKIVAISFILLLFGEVMPKVMATQNNIRFAKDVGLIAELVSAAFGGLGKWLVATSDVIEKKLARKRNSNYALEELDNTASEEEKNILQGIVEFGNITVRQIMRTRMDVNGIEYNSSFDALIARVEELHYSRLPVYKEDLDEVVGILHTKDLLSHIEEPADYDWHGLMRSPYFVHEQKLIEDLLKEFQSKHIHFAIVVDEFGGTSGIVTLEDIMEEIIGDIKDEFDDEDSGNKKLDDNNYIFEGKTMNLPLDTFENVKGDSDSLAGLVLELAGEIPQQNQVIAGDDFDFTVLEVLKNRIQKIKVTIKPKA